MPCVLVLQVNRRWLGVKERLLVLGMADAGVALARELSSRNVELGIDIREFVGATSRARLDDDAEIGGSAAALVQIVRQRHIDRVVVDLAPGRESVSLELVRQLRRSGIPVDDVASVYERYAGQIPIDSVRPSSSPASSRVGRARWLAITKRLLDLVAAVLLLIIAAPVMAAIAAAVKFTSAGPVVYSQRRVGHNGRLFTIRKFRSMHVDAEAKTGPVWATARDPRLTTIGSFLRRTHLDELPQLWNVLVNDMSLVGPRPERPEFVTMLEREIRFYGQRHSIKPGVTGWAQISYPYGASVRDALQKLQYDFYYVKHMSVALDLFIMAATLRSMWSRTGC